MTALVLDAGALIAVDRDDRDMLALLRAAQLDGVALRTNPVVIAQVWRDPRGRQARLARVLRATEVSDIDEQAGRKAGELLGRAGASDVVDATVVLLAHPGDSIATSDPLDIGRLVAAAAIDVTIVPC